ncbi:ARF GTPase-activating protein GIT1-like, partial [Saccoglossus kowalevskii]|uniref:ARF GTPase-activating protein GIT1-like n=1 Tax=Saccoglossus kowalevskii TaxID=10224 RepID=A0ABM0GXD4_SACKO
GRQKLARFNAREFATLIIDILNDARRRSSHRSILRTDHIDIMAYRDPPPAPPPVKLSESRLGVGKVPSTISDDEPLYDSVAGSDDEPDLEEQLNAVEQESSPKSNRRTASMASSELSDGPITIEEYLEVKKAHASAEAKIQQLATMNKNMTQEINLLQSMVQRLMQENSQLRATLVPRPEEAPAISNGHESSPTVEPVTPNTPGKSPRTFGRPQSMFEPRVQQRQNPWPAEDDKIPSTEDLLAGLPSTVGTQLPGVQTASTESHAVVSVSSPLSPYQMVYDIIETTLGSDTTSTESSAIKRSVRQTGTLTKVEERTSQCDSDYDNTTLQTQEDIIQTVQDSLIQNQSSTQKDHLAVSSSSGGADASIEKLPRQEDIIRQTEQITRKIQKLLIAAQAQKHDSFIPCSENIHKAVKEMADLFPEMPSSESVRMALKLLLTSASRLLGECQSVLTSEQISSTDYQQVTQQVITTSFDIAKAAKQLVTLFQ